MSQVNDKAKENNDTNEESAERVLQPPQIIRSFDNRPEKTLPKSNSTVITHTQQTHQQIVRSASCTITKITPPSAPYMTKENKTEERQSRHPTKQVSTNSFARQSTTPKGRGVDNYASNSKENKLTLSKIKDDKSPGFKKGSSYKKPASVHSAAHSPVTTPKCLKRQNTDGDSRAGSSGPPQPF
jgi:hypothetical protein